MKNSKPMKFLCSFIFALFALLMVSCGDMANQAADAAGDMADKAGEAIDGAVDKIGEAIPELPQDKVTHTLPRSEDYLDFAHFGHFAAPL